MKTVSGVILFCLLLVCISINVSFAGDYAQWDYKIVTFVEANDGRLNEIVENELREYSFDGWKLRAIRSVPLRRENATRVFYYLMRPAITMEIN